MHALPLIVFCLATGIAAQSAERRPGDTFRSDVDALIARANQVATAERPMRKPLGGASVLANAQWLCAMGHCHRHYHVTDGALVRASLQALDAARQQDGGYGDAETTGWVADAFQVMDLDGHGAAIDAARRSCAQAGAPASPFEAMVSAVLVAESSGRHPEQFGADALQRGRKLLADAGSFDATAAAAVAVHLVVCQVANRRLDADAAPQFSAAQQRGCDWLFAQQHDGQFGDGRRALPLTGFGLMALQCKPAALRSAVEQQAITAGLRWLLEQQNDDGTWGDSLQNYTTCVAVGALRTFDDARVQPALAKAQRALLAFQNCEQNGYAPGDRDYGSIGYGGQTRGDLSNLHFALAALRQTGLPGDHEALRRAALFLQRTQNLSASNDFAARIPDPEHEGELLDVTSGDDGGASYYPGNSSAGYVVRPDGKAIPRSYGSMTYALLKAYTLAGVPADDPRRQAALGWLTSHWRLDANPGFDPAQGPKAQFSGLFYYYLLMADALDLAGIDEVVVAGDAGGAGSAVAWRSALRRQLEAMQRADGSWLNEENGRWMESNALLCTCYAMLALGHCD